MMDYFKKIYEDNKNLWCMKLLYYKDTCEMWVWCNE